MLTVGAVRLPRLQLMHARKPRASCHKDQKYRPHFRLPSADGHGLDQGDGGNGQGASTDAAALPSFITKDALEGHKSSRSSFTSRPVRATW